MPNNDQAKKNRAAVNSFRQRMKETGFRQRNFYVHDDDWERVKKYLARLRKARE